MMTDHHQHHETIYKAIIALNNTGVYLITHGLYIEAIETLKDSMRFMKESFFSISDLGQMTLVDQASASSHYDAFDRSEYENALQSAYRRKNLVNHRRHLCRDDEMTSTNQIGIVVVSDQDHPSKVHDTLIQKCCNDASFCCVTIDLVPSFDVLGSNFDQLQQQSALILYNLGVAYRCVTVIHQPIFVVATDSNTGNRIALTSSMSVYLEYLTMSFQLMELSHSITRSMLQELPLRRFSLMNVSLNLLLTSLCVLYNLKQMSNENECLFDKHLRYTLALENMVMTIAIRVSMMTGEGENQMMFRAPAA